MRYKKGTRLIHGIGINDADYTIRPTIDGKEIRCSYYTKWESMIGRCYDPKFHKRCPTYKDCTVVEEWKSFMTFRSWMIEQDWKGKELDKDILVPGNKVYGPDTCCFISHAINSLLGDSFATRGKSPQGVSTNRNRFEARVSIDSKRKNLGLYDTPEEASEVYNVAKVDEIHRQADLQTDKRLIKALHRIADTFEQRV